MLTTRMTVILEELMKADSLITSEYLAKVLNVTSRTIRKDIKDLDTIVCKHGGGIQSIRGKGYQLEIYNDHTFLQILNAVSEKDKENFEEISLYPENRVQYIIKRLSLAESYIKLEDLADEMFISKSTLQNDLRDAKQIFQKYGIALDRRPNYGLICSGDEFKLRLCVADHLFKKLETENDIDIFGLMEETRIIREIILEQIKIHDLTCSDIGLNHLICHIAIAYKRISGKHYVKLCSNELNDLEEQHYYQIASEIVNKLENEFRVQYPITEVAYVSILLLGTKMFTEPNLKENELQDIIDHRLYLTIRKILEKVEKELNLPIKNDKELFIALSLHLKPAIHRYKYGINIPNLLLDDIKAKHLVAFQAAVIAGKVLNEDMDIEINENEIGYLALHLGASIEKSKSGYKPKKCIIVCGSGAGSARLLASKLQSQYVSKLEIIGTTQYYNINKIEYDSIDFLISTIPITRELPIPVIRVNTILGDCDFEKIDMMLNHHPDHYAMKYIKEELVFLQKDFKNKKKVLEFLGKQLVDKGLVRVQYLDSVFERERLSPTCYGNFVAIPHPVSPQTESTFWTICTLKKPIDWGEKRVQFVCLLNVEKNCTSDLQGMYDLLVGMIDNCHIIQQLIKCSTYKEFLTYFLQS